MNKKIIATFLLASMLTLTMACDKTDSEETDLTETEAVETVVSETAEPDAGESTADKTGATENGETATALPAYDYMGNDLTPYIALGEYKGLEATAISTVLTDEEYNDYIATMLDSMSYNEQITDRAVAEGETVVTSYSGYLDGVQFDGGTAEGQTVTAADGTGMIDGFGPAFVGQMPGVEFSFKVTFPTVYGNLDLAGKEVTFVCTIDYIQGENVITPELTDAFVRDNFGYETVATFETALRESLALQKVQNAESQTQQTLWTQVVEMSEILGYPEGEEDRFYQTIMAGAESTAQMYGMTLEEYLTQMYQGQVTLTQFEAAAKEQAKSYVKENLIIYQIAKTEGIAVGDEEFNEWLTSLATSYGITAEEFLQYYDKETLMLSLLQEKVVGVVTEHAVIVEATETAASEATETTAE